MSAGGSISSSSKPSRPPIRRSASATCSRFGRAALVGQALPGRPGQGSPPWTQRSATRSAPGRSSSTARASAKRLALRHLGSDAIAGQRAGDEDDEALGAGDPAPAEGERVDLDLEQLAAARPRAGSLRRRPPLSRVFCARDAPPESPVCAPAGAAADLFARLFDQPFQLLEQRVGLFAAAFDQVGDHLLGVAAR